MRVFVAGHNGMVGSALVQSLRKNSNIEVFTQPKSRLDLLDLIAVKKYFKENKFDQIYLAAAKVGGIEANRSFPADFILDNLKIQTNILESAHIYDVNKVLFLGSSCIYPKLSKQPIKEDYLLSDYLEQTNEPYAIAKIAGIKLCESFNRQYGRDYRSIMPTNLYGPNDNFHPENSHVIPGLINRIHEAFMNNKKNVVIWGSGNPKREFLHVKDMASASIFVMNLEKKIFYDHTKHMLSHINVGTGIDITIKDLSQMIAKIIGFKGELVFDQSRPDGTPRKLLDVSKLHKLGWKSSINLETGLVETYQWYKENINKIRKS
tara:strand:- start:338 stop:1297 length:960 start_codon:yes stop_codon:yes gene_type:complete